MLGRYIIISPTFRLGNSGPGKPGFEPRQCGTRGDALDHSTWCPAMASRLAPLYWLRSLPRPRLECHFYHILHTNLYFGLILISAVLLSLSKLNEFYQSSFKMKEKGNMTSVGSLWAELQSKPPVHGNNMDVWEKSIVSSASWLQEVNDKCNSLLTVLNLLYSNCSHMLF